MKWAKRYLKMDMSLVLFIDETLATLDGLGSWVYYGDERHQHLRRQQQGGGVMIWAGITTTVLHVYA